MIANIDLSLTVKTLRMVQQDLQGFLGRVASSVAHPEYSPEDRLKVYELRSMLNSALSSTASARTILSCYMEEENTRREAENDNAALEYLGLSSELPA